ncbi:EF-hand domain-containing protein [Enterovirga sp. CN4-39]|uniref:EF-hand domain-containing protein n=1 Tax=Enterovirga sp. CN4-39 TaxID=3400910 RepID=UPI003BFE0185
MSLTRFAGTAVALSIIAATPVTAIAQTGGMPSTPGQNPPSAQQGMPGAAMMGSMAGGGMCGMMSRMGQSDGAGMMGGGHMMKVMFAIADTNADGALSFEEVSAIHKRIFEAVDANKDGKVIPEELQAFLRP